MKAVKLEHAWTEVHMDAVRQRVGVDHKTNFSVYVSYCNISINIDYSKLFFVFASTGPMLRTRLAAAISESDGYSVVVHTVCRHGCTHSA